MLSVNTNYSAMVALQNMNATVSSLQSTQQEISTGLKVSSAKDNGAVFAIAEGQRARVSAIGAVSDGVSRASSGASIALAAGSSIGSILQQLKDKAVAAQNADLTATQRQALQSDFAAIRSQIDTIVNSAQFNGINLVKGTNNDLSVLTTDLTGAVVASGKGIQTPPGTLDSIVSGSALISQALNSTNGVAAADTITFDDGTNAWSVKVTAAMTVTDFVNAVTTSSGGQILASYNDQTGQFTYITNAAGLTISTDGAANSADAIGAAQTYSATVQTSSTSAYTITGNDFSLTGAMLSAIGTANVSTSVTTATTASTAIDTAITQLNDKLAKLGSQAKALDIQKDFLSKLSDTIESGIGNLVDADLAKDSAKLQSLQIKQQLGAQALSIANQSPQVILSLFR